MASDQVKKSDLFEDGLFDDVQKGAADAIKAIDGLVESFTELQVVTRNKQNTTNANTADDLKKITTASIELAKQEKIIIQLEKEKQKLIQEREKTNQSVIKTISQERKELEAEAKAKEKSTKETQKLLNESKKLNSVYEQNKKQLKSVSDRYKELVSRGKEGTRSGQLLKAEFEKLDKIVRKAEESVGQFNRNVGNYKNAMKEAIHESGIFNNGIGRIVVGLTQLKEKFEENSKSSNKFSANLKLGAAAAVGAVILALKELVEVNATLAEGFEKLGAQIGGFITGGFEGAKAAGDFKDALFESYIILRQLGLSLQQVTLDEEDFTDIANDTTIGFKERNEALKESIRLSQERAKLAVEIAQVELDVIDKQVKAAGIGLRAASPELLNKQAEARKKLNAELDVQADLIRENAQRERQQAVERTTTEIDLLLKNKQSANARATILEQELANEKNQLEERRKIANELLKVNLNTTNEELRIFKAGLKVKFDSNALLQEQDNIILKQKIESIKQLDENNKLVGLGAEATKKLAEIIKKAQEAQIENGKTIKQLDEEELKRKQRIANINEEIRLLQQRDLVSDLQRANDELNEAQEKNLDKTLEGEKAFNTKLQNQRKLQRNIEIQQRQEILQEQIKLLTETADFEKKKIDETVNDKKIAAAEKLKIDQQLSVDLGNLTAEAAAKELAAKDKAIEDDKKIFEKRIQIAAQYANKVLDNVESELEKESQLRNDALNKGIDDREKAADRQRAIAEKGLQNTLAFEEEQKAKLELAREQEKAKEVKRQKAISFLRLLAGYAEQDPNTALSKALVDIAIATAVQGAFYEGTENVADSLGKPVLAGKDGHIVRVDGSERIMTGEQNKMVGNMSNEDLATLAKSYHDGIYLPKYMMDSSVNTGSLAGNMANSAMLHQLMSVNKKLQGLEKVIANKKEQSVNLDNVGNVIVSEVENGLRKTVLIKKRRSRI